LRELGEFIGERGCSGGGGCGVVVMEQVTRGSGCDRGEGGAGVAGDDGGGCAAKGAWGGGSAHGGGHACEGHR
jgi:hypothetical protein